MASRISLTAMPAPFTVNVGKWDAMAAIRSVRVIARILPSVVSFAPGQRAEIGDVDFHPRLGPVRYNPAAAGLQDSTLQF